MPAKIRRTRVTGYSVEKPALQSKLLRESIKKSLYFIASLWCVFTTIPIQAVINIGSKVVYKENTIEVLGPESDSQSTNLQAVIDSITDEAADNPYLIKLGPGEYLLEPEVIAPGIQMVPYISIQGSGQGITILKGEISTGALNATSAIVAGANNASLKDLSVENRGTDTYSIAILNLNASPRIENVTVRASGGTQTFGIYNGFAAPLMRNITARTFGPSVGSGGFSVGIYNEISIPTMHNITVFTQGGHTNTGVLNHSSSAPIMQNVTIVASSGTNAIGIDNTSSSSPTMQNINAQGRGATNNLGLRTDSSSSPKANSSIFSGLGGGASGGVDFNDSSGTQIVNSRIVGGAIDDGLGAQCKDNYDQNLSTVFC